ncbi:caspase family protein [Methylomagnum sp.]
MKSYTRLWGTLVMLGLAVMPPPGRADTHALIMGIGHYADPKSRLPGIDKDRDRARTIARHLGVKDSRITELGDSQLTLAGTRRAFDDLLGKVGEDDAVFVYYSGHGSRRMVGQSCAESLVTYDGKPFTDQELEGKLRQLSEKSRKLVVFLDACFSGGATRARSRAYEPKAVEGDAKPVPKYLPGDDCSQPVNATRDYRVLQSKWGVAVDNFIHVAAARDDEVSFATDGGSLATQAWLRCLEEGVPDSDGSGGLTAKEIQHCAQANLDRQADFLAPDKPDHITLIGNRDTVLNLSDNLIPDPAPAPPDAKAALQDIYHSRDARRRVEVQLAQDSVRINQDWLSFRVTSAESGYVSVLMVGSDGTTFDVLFPNREDRDNHIAAGQTLDLPRPNWRLRAAGPAGVDHLLVLVSPEPRDFSGLITTQADPFGSIATTRQSTSGVQSTAGAAGCAGSACDYGAALVQVRETP